ncbi:hypothetical protein AB4Z51_29140 [Bradyrhizobium sp. 2TAF36]|uniref:hypothetical protein n=1 Tax=Bradyrhizobium sp. 2TAF36 TaxID=3233016 RepID=UPI003F90F3D7
MAKIVHRDPETVAVAMRRLREAGLVEVTGKGRAGKQMSARDAATLLLAVTSGATLKDSPATIRGYWNLQPVERPHAGASWGHAPGSRPSLGGKYFARLFTKQIGPLDPFGVALTALIEAATEGPLFPAPLAGDWMSPAPNGDGEVPGGHLHCGLEVRIFGPTRAASIAAHINYRQWQFERHYAAPGEVGSATGERERADRPASGSGPYLETRMISVGAILAIGESLR